VVCWRGAQVSGCGVTEGGEDTSIPLLWHVSACTPHGTVPHRRRLCACFHKHTAGIGTPVFRNVLKCFNGNCMVYLLSVLASIGVRTEGNGLFQICATLFNRPVVRMELLLVRMEEFSTTAESIMKRSTQVKRRTQKKNRRVPFHIAN
jgi:hypothetical protein